MGDLYNLDWAVPNQDVIDWGNGKNRIVPSGVNLTTFNLGSVIPTGLGLLNGVAQLGAIGQTAADINDSPMAYAPATNLENVSSYGFDNYGQIISAEDASHIAYNQDFRKVRGRGDLENVGSVGAGMIAGGAAGSMLGPIGAAIGAGIGGLYSGLKVWQGNVDADARMSYNNMRFNRAQDTFLANKAASMEDIQNRKNAQSSVRVVKNGGQIQREQEDIQHFANRILGKKNSILPQRTICKDGVMVKIRTK